VTREYSATVNAKDAKVTYAGAAPGLVFGVYQVNVQLPEDLATGPATITVTIAGVASQPGVTVFAK
jgi:uncharacterized protein (TIGR03437 family)